MPSAARLTQATGCVSTSDRRGSREEAPGDGAACRPVSPSGAASGPTSRATTATAARPAKARLGRRDRAAAAGGRDQPASAPARRAADLVVEGERDAGAQVARRRRRVVAQPAQERGVGGEARRSPRGTGRSRRGARRATPRRRRRAGRSSASDASSCARACGSLIRSGWRTIRCRPLIDGPRATCRAALAGEAAASRSAVAAFSSARARRRLSRARVRSARAATCEVPSAAASSRPVISWTSASSRAERCRSGIRLRARSRSPESRRSMRDPLRGGGGRRATRRSTERSG